MYCTATGTAAAAAAAAAATATVAAAGATCPHRGYSERAAVHDIGRAAPLVPCEDAAFKNGGRWVIKLEKVKAGTDRYSVEKSVSKRRW